MDGNLNLWEEQVIQYEHDTIYHADVYFLPRSDRLKHYGLHFAKYVGRFARGVAEPKSVEQTLVDAFLISLASANTLEITLPSDNIGLVERQASTNFLLEFADSTGRYCDACEKMDHLEEFLPAIKSSNLSICELGLTEAEIMQVDLKSAAEKRRKSLRENRSYITRRYPAAS